MTSSESARLRERSGVRGDFVIGDPERLAALIPSDQLVVRLWIGEPAAGPIEIDRAREQQVVSAGRPLIQAPDLLANALQQQTVALRVPRTSGPGPISAAASAAGRGSAIGGEIRRRFPFGLPPTRWRIQMIRARSAPRAVSMSSRSSRRGLRPAVPKPSATPVRLPFR